MGSTYLDSGTSKKSDIIASVKDGIYVAQMGG
jgi:predicted Zn-dependent protease